MSIATSKVVGLVNYVGDESDLSPPWNLFEHGEEASHVVCEEVCCNQSNLVVELNQAFNRFRSQSLVIKDR